MAKNTPGGPILRKEGEDKHGKYVDTIYQYQGPEKGFVEVGPDDPAAAEFLKGNLLKNISRKNRRGGL